MEPTWHVVPLSERERASLAFDAALAKVARRQHGVVARTQLRSLGMGNSGVDAHLRRGALHVVHRGVFAVGHPVLTSDGHRMAAVLAAGPFAALTHRSGAESAGFRRSAASFHEVTSPRHRRSRRGLFVHCAPLPPEELTTFDRIPTTTPSRTLLDLADVLPAAGLRRAVREADRLGLFDRTAIDATMERHAGRRAAIRLLRAAAPELARDAVVSPLEDDFLDVLERFGLPMPLTDVVLEGRERDAWWPQASLVVELDSRTYHSGAAAFEDDRARDAHLVSLGYRTMRFTRRRVHGDAAGVARELRLALAAPHVRVPETREGAN